MPENVKIQLRRGTDTEWNTVNPILAEGEPGVEINTHKTKYGDGVTNWNNLSYSTGPVDGVDVPVQEKRDTAANWAASTDALLSGQIGYDITNGRFKIGNGADLWVDLPDPGKQFHNVVTVSKSGAVGSADFICSSSVYGGSDAACIQDVMNKVPSNSIIHFMEGTYNINTAIISLGKNFSLVGDGNVIWNVGTAGSLDTSTIRLSGSSVLNTTLSIDASIYSITVTLLDVSNITKGDLISIFNTDLWSPIEVPGHKTGEMYEVMSVDTGAKTVTISQPLYRTYLSSNTTVKIYRPANISIENINFVGIGRTEQSNALHILYGSHSRIENCSFFNFGKRAISLATCYNTTIMNNKIQGCAWAGAYGLGYGIMIVNGCAFVKIDKNEIIDCRHTVAAGSGDISYDGTFVGGNEVLNRGVLITNNLLVGAIMETSYGNTIDSHPMTIDYTVIGNKIYPALHIDATYPATYAFGDGAQTSIFSNNEIYGGGGVMRRTGAPSSNCIIENNILENTRGAGLYTGYEYNNHTGCLVNLKIQNNSVKNANKTPQMTTPADHVIYLGYEDYRSVSIQGNTVDGCTADVLRLHESVGISTGPIELSVESNIFNNIGGYGVYLRRAETSTLVDFLIQNNIITETNQAGSIYGGIALIDVENGRVECNKIINRVASTNPAIKEVSMLTSAINNNHITNNTVSGFSGGIVKVGPISKIYNNNGYVTENTGNSTIAATFTSVVVNHGLAVTPTNVVVTPKGNVGYCWVDTYTATQFTIHCSVAPAANTDVNWSAVV